MSEEWLDSRGLDLDGGRVWFIAGACDELGREMVRAALERGDFVVAAGRQPEIFEDGFSDYTHALVTVRMDADDPQDTHVAVRTAIRCFGHIDILINNAGASLIGAIEEAGDLEVRRLFDANLFGALGVMREVLPYMRTRRCGHVVTLITGQEEPAAGFGLTHAARGALLGLSEALMQELKPLGVQVTTIDTGLSSGRLGRAIARQVIADYGVHAGPARLRDETVDQALLAGRVAAVLETVGLPEAPGRLVLGERAYERALRRLDSLRAELSVWRDLSLLNPAA